VWLIRVSLTMQLKAVSMCSITAADVLYRSMKSGRGFPMAFFKAPVMVKAAPTLKPRPSIPQFNSHSLSFSLYLPLRRFMPDLPVGMAVWCEKRPSTTRVYNAIMTAGARMTYTPSQMTGTRSFLAKV
jgi:hypothetical protein